MQKTNLCRCNHITVKKQDNIELEDVSVSIEPHRMIAFISKDGSASHLLKAIAGLKRIDKGKISYLDDAGQQGKPLHEFMQYIPNCGVEYSNLDVASFFQGLIGNRREWLEEAVRLLAECKIDVKAQLSALTPEQNRLVSIIQALMKKPELLLWDTPANIISMQKYGIILKEIIQLYASGSTIVLTASNYEDIILPCHTYIFMKDGRVRGEYSRSQLPQPANVVTLWGGTSSVFDLEKMTILEQRKEYCRFIYKEDNKKELAVRLGMSECRDFNVETLTLEETLFEEYERWQV